MEENLTDQSHDGYGAEGIREPWGFSATRRRSRETSGHVTSAGTVPTGFRMRLFISIGSVFLCLMVVFLTFSFVSERRLYHRLTFEHLDEALEILTVAVGLEGDLSIQEVAQIEAKLSDRTGVEHRLIVTDADGAITSASTPDSVGESIESIAHLEPQNSPSGYKAYGRIEGRNWLAAAIPRSDLFLGDRLFLFRARAGSDEFIRDFARIHGLHVLITLIAMGGLVQFIGRRYVTRPIHQLASAINRIETGDMTTEIPVNRMDEFGWLAQRFTEMGGKLKDAIRRLVRSEKFASVSIVTFRIGRNLHDPLRSLERHITYIDGLSSGSGDLERIAMALRQDRAEIMKAIRQLEEIEPPGD